MALTKEQKRKIYEEELERIKARERIQAQRDRQRQPKSFRAMDLVIIIGFLIMLYVVFGGGK